jgi:alpha-D-xyloside xylohydrolase
MQTYSAYSAIAKNIIVALILMFSSLILLPMKSSTFMFLSLFSLLLACETPPKNIQYTDIFTQKDGRSYLLQATDGRKMRITPYGTNMVRVQRVKAEQDFYADDHYEMVEQHDWQVELKFSMLEGGMLQFTNTTIKILVDPKTLTTSYYQFDIPLLSEKSPISHTDNITMLEFSFDSNEHFSGLGHGYFGRAQSIDLKGQRFERNYGSEPIEQAPLIVPFYVSSKGYGLFLNSMFSNSFNFGQEGRYQISLDDSGFNAQMDVFFIAGPKLPQVLDNYTQLTGRPRLPAKSMFGLQLSDKGHDHNSSTPSDEIWWKAKINAHRQAGYPLDHVVNDNRWRAAGGKRCESKIEWDKERYPDPAEYAKWLKQNGLVTTLDFNRCIGQFSDGWQAEFNLPETGEIEFKDSAPDLTNPDFQAWFWEVFYEKSLDPNLAYPGDALWIDEFDEQGGAPKKMLLANGLSSAEMRNYWFFLIAKSLVAEGWDKSKIKKRPFVWVRGMTAGAQRWATLWSGDIYPNYKDMEGQIRAMQLAGLSGFPFWGHDAGGFFDWDSGQGPDENIYQQWAMAFGSFAPIWKPHGMGQSRWPLDRSNDSQKVAMQYAKLRYELMPYIYAAAHVAAQSGLPIARAMILDYQDMPLAWKFDLQYMWGDALLVAPLTADSGEKQIWLPPGNWFEYGTANIISGNQIIKRQFKTGELPILIKEGAIIPKRQYAKSTAFIDKSHLNIDVYLGGDGQFTLFEDDDMSEDYRQSNMLRKTLFQLDQQARSFEIHPAIGSYAASPDLRSYVITFLGIADNIQVWLNGKQLEVKRQANKGEIVIAKTSVHENILITFKLMQ